MSSFLQFTWKEGRADHVMWNPGGNFEKRQD